MFPKRFLSICYNTCMIADGEVYVTEETEKEGGGGEQLVYKTARIILIKSN
jgi:hypothetical protein